MAIKCINDVGKDISPMLILTSTQQLALWFNNNLDDNIAVTTTKTRFTNDWILLQWVKHFKKFSVAYLKDMWHLLLMDGYRSHHIYKFLKFCADYRIKPVGIPPHTTHLLQPLDVYIFQSLKH